MFKIKEMVKAFSRALSIVKIVHLIVEWFLDNL